MEEDIYRVKRVGEMGKKEAEEDEKGQRHERK